MHVGLDFGTTNSALGVALPDGSVRLATFTQGGASTSTFRSILYCDPQHRSRDGTPHIVAGPEAIDAYLRADPRGRLILSPKSFLASRLFTKTSVYGTSFSLEELIGILLRDLRRQAEVQLGDLGRRVLVGRPVVFAGAESEEDEAFALERLTRAVQSAGFDEVRFEREPVAASYRFSRRVDRERLVLIADLGGGTSDFSLVRLGPPRAGSAEIRAEILGTSGVAVGGDAFDGRIVRHVVSPALGRGTEYRGANLKLHPVPLWIYGSLERWHQMALLGDPETMRVLREIGDQAVEKEKIRALVEVIERNLGYDLYRSVEETKHALSTSERAELRFDRPGLTLRSPVGRTSFAAWIREELSAVGRSVDELLDGCGVDPGRISRVFMTGGSSFVPAVRRVFEERFGPDRMQGGGELTSVAEGLALGARLVFG
jgi:hypothetical chaperone protein